ncbi:MAG: polymer-forming cytoskeletal protein [Massilibacteroides sp.]|nr:polymer-forming cytoskeletal protein [Massilibacteroides sp.]MDD3062521.1 polymer-forming cytoskeletal protein [Massilibacteroides sp.]MDD4115534.1 polymer-forming cytoskeletal protein [Massilibacteroides sp.]MDD4660333.1 polymer-forming cytoskeletal protein [Massilibacteroides sp.]
MFFSKRKNRDKEVDRSSLVVAVDQDLVALGNLTLSGEQKGSFFVKERVTILPDSFVVGDITAVDGIIGGKVSGNLVCAGDLWLKSTAVVDGMVMAKTAVIETGCVINATVLLSPDVCSKLLSAKLKEAEKEMKKNVESPPPSVVVEPQVQTSVLQEKKIVQQSAPKTELPVNDSPEEQHTGWW